MAATTDLGSQMARCDGDELEIMQPEYDDSPACSIRIMGRSNLLELARFIQETVASSDKASGFLEGIETINPDEDIPQ